MRSRFRTDVADTTGSITAEFAAVVPAVVLLLAIALGGIRLAGEQLELQAAVQDASRLLARGDPGANARVLLAEAGASVSDEQSGSLVCVRARAPADLGILIGLVLSASACALDER